MVPDPKDIPISLRTMREQMLAEWETNPAAAVFVGGDNGILMEQTLFSSNYPAAPVYALGGPGGAAREMAEKLIGSNPKPILLKMANSRNYIALMFEVVKDIEGHLNRKTRPATAH